MEKQIVDGQVRGIVTAKSYLFVPATRTARFMGRALARGAGAVIADLEDTVRRSWVGGPQFRAGPPLARVLFERCPFH